MLRQTAADVISSVHNSDMVRSRSALCFMQLSFMVRFVPANGYLRISGTIGSASKCLGTAPLKGDHQQSLRSQGDTVQHQVEAPYRHLF